MKIPINGKYFKSSKLNTIQKETDDVFNSSVNKTIFVNPKSIEDEALRELEQFCQELKYKIIKLNLINPRITLKSIKFGEDKPEHYAKLLEVSASLDLNISNRKIGFRALIADRDLA